ncbi:MAG: nucleoside triphosphate pyrophosphohydrolase [Gammaproteobacteria bacterium]|nr:nucleoside triphosphate pyrophosphohydrolase [Gammaproteobacteria bacterium]
MVDIEKLLEIMRRLRDPAAGCPWDLQQDFRSIAPYTIEEAFEVADAIERADLSDLRDELGDLLFQVVFHAQMASETGAFAFRDVVAAICEKMQRRHPHVFAGEQIGSAAEQSAAWEQHKARERESRPRTAASVLDGIPKGLPAIARAMKLGERAAETGFDWPDLQGVRRKLGEELDELDEAIGAGARADIEAEIGDLLFAIANLSRHLDVDPESALRASNAKFARRFAFIEQRVRAAGRGMREMPLDELDALWNAAKAEK